jgi:hypothetical protein
VNERTSGLEAAGRASCGPGLFYRVRYGSDIEFICIDTSKENFFGKRLYEFPKHWSFLESAFSADAGPGWRIPFSHHPPFSAGPRHHNTRSMAALIPLFGRAGVKVMFSGHEHNFQHSFSDGIHYFVTGAAGQFRGGTPDEMTEAHTRSWSAQCHFLLVRIAGDRMVIRAIGGSDDAEKPIADIARIDPFGAMIAEPMQIER